MGNTTLLQEPHEACIPCHPRHAHYSHPRQSHCSAGADKGSLKSVASSTALDYGPLPADATAAIQAAIDSGASRVLIPYNGTPWIVRPLFDRVSNQEIALEPGVGLMAKRESHCPNRPAVRDSP